MSIQKIKTIPVATGINPNFLESTLTEDINPLASLFDLIDNSIDAARDHLMRSKYVSDEYGLPADYSGYQINLRIDKDSIRILDNCLGIDEEILSNKIFLIADVSNHSFGIGHYGIGLKRALLKFGSNYALATDTGKAILKVRFDSQGLSGSSAEKISADVFRSKQIRKTLVSISNIKSQVKYEIASDYWYENAISELSTRYAIFVSKGLKIKLRSIIHHKASVIGVMLPKLRTNGKFPPQKMNPIIIDKVNVFIESGIHEKYFFPTETDYSLKINRTLTKSFGLYFICNDRVIVSNSLTPAHGWTAVWHSEYNGFVCLVRFVSENSGKMPWNTAKTGLRTDSTIFLKVKDQLQPCADFYRKDIKRRYPAKGLKESPPNIQPEIPQNSITPTSSSSPSDQKNQAAENLHLIQPEIPQNPITPTSSSSPSDQKSQAGENLPLIQAEIPQNSIAPISSSAPSGEKSQAAQNLHLHVKSWVTLLPIHFPHGDDNVLNAYIIEAISLLMSDAPYACAMLYRALLEAALKRFVYTSGNFQKVKDHFYSSTEGKKKNHTDAQKQGQGIAPPLILPWLNDNLAVFDDENRAVLTLAVKKTQDHLPFLNGVVHGLQLIDVGRLTNVRNDTVTLLEFLVLKGVKGPKNV